MRKVFKLNFRKHGIDSRAFHIVDLFDDAICSNFPPLWSQHIIHPIFKSENNFDPDNYKTVVNGDTFAKLYATLLNM